MSRTIYCVKLNKEAEGLAFAPWPGELGKRIMDNVSQEAWQEWLKMQTMLINEKQLSLIKPDDKAYLAEQIEAHFFGDGAEQPEGYTPPST